LTFAREINMRNAICKGKFAIACEAVEHEGITLITLDITWSFEKFVEHSADQIL